MLNKSAFTQKLKKAHFIHFLKKIFIIVFYFAQSKQTLQHLQRFYCIELFNHSRIYTSKDFIVICFAVLNHNIFYYISKDVNAVCSVLVVSK